MILSCKYFLWKKILEVTLIAIEEQKGGIDFEI
jgi:hypothetical protein